MGLPCDDEYASESRSAAVQKCYKLVEGGLLEISVKDGGTNNSGHGKEDELDGYNNLVHVNRYLLVSEMYIPCHRTALTLD
jgi:uncharacterized protein (UPF0248 family)